MKTIAVFDVDGTLISDNIGVTFVKYLNKRRAIHLLPKLLILVGFSLYKMKLANFDLAIRLGSLALTGIGMAEASRLAEDCLNAEILPRVFGEAKDEIARLKSVNAIVIFATGAHEAIARPFGARLGADQVVCTTSAVRNETYSWATNDPIPYRYGKKQLVQATLDCYGDASDPKTVIVYTDEEKDLPLLELADQCVGVNPDEVVAKYVRDRGGRIAIFD